MKNKLNKRFGASLLVFFMLAMQVFPIGNVYAETMDIDIEGEISNFKAYDMVFQKLEELRNKIEDKIKGKIDDIKNELTTPAQIGSQGMSGLNRPNVPQVEVTFSAEDAMANGSKVTAQAAVSGFMDNNTDHKPYYTWYLKRANCDLSRGLTSSNSRCDLDADGEVTVNDWKIAAAKIIVQGENGRYSESDGDINADSGDSGHEAWPSVKQWKKSYDNGADNVSTASGYDNIPNCHVYEKESGMTFELRSDSDGGEFETDTCPDGYHVACVETTPKVCEIDNPAYVAEYCEPAYVAAHNLPVSDPNYLPGECVAEHLPVEGLNMCKETGVKPDCEADPAKKSSFGGMATCEGNATPLCVLSGGADMTTDPNIGIIFTSGNTSDVCSEHLLQPKVTATTQYWGQTEAAKCEGGIVSTYSEKINAAGLYEYRPVCVMRKTQKGNMCKHLFPVIPKKIGINGDGEFSREEKNFWGANPNTGSTNNVNKDEEATTGFGVTEFTWTYIKGDKIGVVVEGATAIPTEHNDGSYKIMWAFSKNKCDEIDELKGGKGNQSYYVESKLTDPNNPYVGENQIGIYTANLDLDKCLKDNLIDPFEVSQVEMDVSIDVAPKELLNIPNEITEDNKVTATAMVGNVSNTERLYYEWRVEKSLDGAAVPVEDTTWIDIMTDMKNQGSFKDGDEQGIGKDVFNFNLNLTDEILGASSKESFYLRLKTYVSDYSGDGSKTTVKGTAIVKVKKQNDGRMQVFSSSAAADGLLNKGIVICTETGSPCGVSVNEILAVTVSDPDNSLEKFSWKVDGKETACNSSISAACSEAGGNTLFFPVRSESDDIFEVEAQAIDTKISEVVTIKRKFVLMDPGVKLVSADGELAWPRELFDGSGETSEEVLETFKGNVVKMKALVTPAYKERSLTFSWSVNGQEKAEFNGRNEISLETNDKEVGDVLNLGLTARQKTGAYDLTGQMENLRFALAKNWGIVAGEDDDQFNGLGETIVQIEVLDGSEGVLASKKGGNFNAASLITHLPAELMFLLRILLTAALLLFSAGVIFSVIPGVRAEK